MLTINYIPLGKIYPGAQAKLWQACALTGTQRTSQSHKEEDAKPNGRGHGKGVAMAALVHSLGTEEPHLLKVQAE